MKPGDIIYWPLEPDGTPTLGTVTKVAGQEVTIAFALPEHERTITVPLAVAQTFFFDRDKLAHDLEPVPERPIDRDEAIRFFVDGWDRLTGIMTRHVDSVIAQLTKDSEPGDELWLCRSRYIGALFGHHGLGIVRDGRVLRYERMRVY